MESWIWIIVVASVAILAAGGAWALRAWRKHSDVDDNASELWDLVEDLLDALEKETKRRLQELPQSQVEAAAREVYRRFVAGTPLVNLVDEQQFVALVVDQWRKLAGLNKAVIEAVALVEARERDKHLTFGPAPPAG